MKKIVITGALGHIGSQLIRRLPDEIKKCEIIMIDNMLTQRYSSLFDLPDNGNYRFLEADILKADLKEIFKNADVVVHLAAITNAAGSFEKPEEVEEVNFVGTKKVIQACKDTGAKLIFLSTTSVYGTQGNVVDEDCGKENLQPQSPYAQSKLKSEEILKSLKDEIDFVILRFGTIFGYSIGMRFHTAVNKFCWQSVIGQPLTVWKTAYNQKRPYLDLEDAIKALVFVINNNVFNGEIYNVLTYNLTVKDIVDSIKLNISNIDIDFVESKIMNQLSYDVANEKFKKLGFEYGGDLDASIRKTIDILKNSNKI